jgi:ABC-2 type transport system ATP-binding protein
MAEYVLETDGLCKNFSKLKAVNDLNLKIKKGVVFGLLGPNGSGKSTTLGMLLGVTQPSSGSFKWFERSSSHKERLKIGAILEKPNFYPHLSAFKNLQIVAMIKSVDKERIDEVLKKVHLHDRKNSKFKTFSLGMKQRLSIASSLLSNPQVLVLDEPTNGLDPQGIADIRELIIEIANSGKTIILASHLLDEVQKVCSEFAILNKGKLVYQGLVDENFSSSIVVEISSTKMDDLEDIIKKRDDFVSLSHSKDFISVKFDETASPDSICEFLFSNKVILTHLNFKKKTLEDQFLEILEDKK